MTEALARQTYTLPLASILPPALDARIGRDEDQLEELGRDILTNGLIEPIKVVRVEENFEIVDGFCRFLAVQRVNLTTIEAFIYPDKITALEGVKYRANMFRQEMSAADEAVMFHQLLTHECENDIERLGRLVNQKITYIDNRLALLNGDELVFDALREKKIKIGVAHEINKVTDPGYRRYYLTHAIHEGSSLAVVSGWVQEWRKLFGNTPTSTTPASELGQIVPQPSLDVHYCYICAKSDPRHLPEQISVHTHCKLAILDPMLAAARGAE